MREIFGCCFGGDVEGMGSELFLVVVAGDEGGWECAWMRLDFCCD